MNEKISVIMATCNGAKYLRRQIDSILSQTTVPDEVIICDDRSTDSTMKILNEYSKNYAFVKVFENGTRLGPIKNFEKCLKNSTGDIIFFSDQDDVWFPNKIENMLSQAGNYLCCYSDSYIIDEYDNIIKNSEITDHHKVYPADGNNFLFFLLSNSVSGHNLMINRKLLDDLLPFPDNIMYDQWIALVSSAKYKLKFIPDRYCYHRIHLTNFVNNPALRKNNNKKSKYQRHEERFERVKEMLKFLQHASVSEEKIRLLNLHVETYDDGIYSFRLFLYLLKNSRSIFPGGVSWNKINLICKFCRQRKGLWLPSLKL